MPRYDPPNGSYTTRIPPGMSALRRAVADVFGYTRTEVVRDRSRCNQTGSEHCECRACDWFTTDLVKGRRTFNALVACAEDLGIQSVIFNRRVWGFGKWYERHYSGPSPHTDHVHAGIDRATAATLTYDFAVMVLRQWAGGAAPTPTPPDDEEDDMAVRKVVLVQQTDDDEVYELEPDQLRHVYNGEIATRLYGDNWGSQVVRLPPTDDVWDMPVYKPAAVGPPA